MADVTTATPGIAGPERVRAESAAGTGYRTFPSRLPVLLTVLGGGFVLVGALGVSVRASAITRTEEDPRTVRVLMGTNQAMGWVLAGLGLALVVTGFLWLRKRGLVRLVPAAVSIAGGVAIALRLVRFNDIAAGWAAVARETPRFIGFHGGLGWGAWCLLVGAILAGFGTLVGVLREIDLRRGIAG